MISSPGCATCAALEIVLKGLDADPSFASLPFIETCSSPAFIMEVNKNKIEIIYCDLDVFKQNSLICEYSLSAKGFSPQYGCHMYIMKWCSDHGYFFLAGNGEMDLVFRHDEYYMMDEQREFTLDNFCKLHNLTGVWQFWKQDGRLISSFLKLPTVRLLLEKKVKSLLDHKHQCFSDVFNFEPRPKYTGFEKIQEWDSILRNYMKQSASGYDDVYYTPISTFVQK